MILGGPGPTAALPDVHPPDLSSHAITINGRSAVVVIAAGERTAPGSIKLIAPKSFGNITYSKKRAGSSGPSVLNEGVSPR